MTTPQTSPTDSTDHELVSFSFYQKVLVPKAPEIKKEAHKSFKNKVEIIRNSTKDWDKLQQPDKKSYLEHIKLRIEDYEKADCQIRIGDAIFNCYKIVLQCYSDYFKNLSTKIDETIYLPAEEVNSLAFVKIYEWMLATNPKIERNGIIEFYKAAKFLKIKELQDHILICFDNNLVFNEDTAFSLYWEARFFNETVIKQIMAIRIQKFFLTMIAVKEFLEMTCEEVCSFLSKSSIGVRRESDVFYSGLKWLVHNWEERKPNVMNIMECIRFTLMTPWELTELRKNNKSLKVQMVTVFPGVLELIDNALTFVNQKLWSPKKSHEKMKILFEKLNIKNNDERNWIKDTSLTVLNVPVVDLDRYEIFFDYLKMISLESEEYWRKQEFSDVIQN